MHYDPIKRLLGKAIGRKVTLRILFYKLLDLLLLRSWHVRKELRSWGKRRKHAHVLDAGSGFGQYSWFMSRRFRHWKISGIELKEEQVADCNNFFAKMHVPNAIFETGNLTRFVRPDSFDLIIAIDVMEHIDDDESVFLNFFNSLRSGGMLLISTPSDKGGSDVRKDEEKSFIEEHVRQGYNIEEICIQLRNAGFSKAEGRYQYGKPGNLSWRLSMKYPVILLGQSKLFFFFLPFYYLAVFPFCLLLNLADLKLRHKSGTGLIVKAWK